MSTPNRHAQPIMNSNDLVTVIAVCYNHEKWVWETLESIRAQTYPHIQLIIMDDCSRDSSVKTIEQWMTETKFACHFIPHSTNQGLCKTLNEALSHAQGEYIAIIATDDIWFENHLEDRINHFKRNSNNIAVIYGEAILIDEKGVKLSQQFGEMYPKHHSDINTSYFDSLVHNNFICAPSAVIRHSSLGNVGLYDETLSYEDWDMWLRLSKHYGFRLSPIITTKYRIVQNSLSRSLGEETMKTAYNLISKHLKDCELTNQQKRLIRNKLYEITKMLYLGDYKDIRPILIKNLLSSLNHKTLGIFLLSLIISGKKFKALQHLCQ